MKILAPLAIRGAPAWEARAATQGRPYNWAGSQNFFGGLMRGSGLKECPSFAR
jgi:hypothetical protein